MPIQKAIHQKYGTSEGKSIADGGMYCGYGPEQVYEVIIDLADLTQDENVINDVLIIPDNCLLTKVKTQALVSAATGVAIDVGLVHISRDTSDAEFTADPNGLLAAFPIANMAVGEQAEFILNADALASISPTDDNAFAGELIGTVIPAPCFITASATTSTLFTAGKVAVYLHTIPAAVSS